MRILRPYQQQAIDAVFAAEARGVRCQALVLATGLGKTVLFAHLIVKRGGRALVLAHRDELLQQAAQKILTVHPGAQVGIVRGDLDQHDAQIVVASVATLSRERRLKRLKPDFSTVIVDECFPAGTLIDGIPIERIKVGDTVNCYDHSRHQITSRKVTETMRKPASVLVEIVLSNNKRIICTPNHPIYSKAVSDYVPAITLRAGSEVFSQKEKVPYSSEGLFGMRSYLPSKKLEQYDDSDLFGSLQSGSTGSSREEGSTTLSLVRSLSYLSGAERVSAGAERASLLFGCLPVQFHPAQKQCYRRANKQEIRLSADARKESHKQAGSLSQNISKLQRAYLPLTGWQWPINRTAEVSSTGAGLADGGSNHYCAGQWPVSFTTSPLQGGHRERSVEACNRSGRQQSQNSQVEVPRSQEDGNLECVRVESIEILERGSNSRFEQVCADGYVYNFSVEEHHNYFAEGVLVHNCHHSAAASYEKVFEHVAESNPLLVGVTATPDRADGKGLDKWFSEVVFEMGIDEGIRQGWLANLEGRLIHLKGADFSRVHVRKGDYDLSELEQIMEAANWHEHVGKAWAEHARERKSVIFVPKVAMAKALAEHIRSLGGAAEAIDGAMKIDDRRGVLKRLNSGATRVVVNCAVLTEGFDEPSLDCVIMARPTKSRALYVQCVGRGLRLHDGKENCLILDMVGVSQRHDLVSLASLAGVEKLKFGEKFTDAQERSKEEAEQKAKEEAEEKARIEAEHEARRINLLNWQATWSEPVKPKKQFYWQANPFDQQETLRIKQRTITLRPMAGGSAWLATDGGEFRCVRSTANECRAEAESYAKTLLFSDENAPWKQKPATEKQLARLRQWRINFQDGITVGEASRLIEAKLKSFKRESVNV